MIPDVSTGSLVAMMPEIVFTVPGVGDIDATPYVAAAAIFIALSVLFKVVLVVVISRLKKISERTSTDVDDVVISALQGVRPWVYTIVALFAAIQTLEVPEMADKAILGLFLFAAVWQLIDIAAQFVDYGASRFLEKDEDGDGEIDPGSTTASHMVTLLSRIILWALGALFVLSNLGIEVTSLLAGLGIGGIAIAFALQGILSDLFASFSIYFDKPFRIGDFVVLGSDSGTVEKIGMKTTRLRTLQGEELVVSNAELTTARVQNFKKMEERRIVSQFGVLYETPQEVLKEIPGVVTRIFEDIENARLDRVHFTTFGDSALIYEVVYYIDSSQYAVALDAQQEYNFKLMERFAEMGVEFAYPTQTVYHKAIS